MFPNYLKKELSVLFFVINKQKTSLNEISNTLSLSKRMAKESIMTINNHCDQIFIVSDNSGAITIHPELKMNALSHAYKLKLSLLKNNVLFNYCVLLITKPKIEREKILEQLFISRTYLNKLTRQLRTFFSHFNFTITIQKGYYSLEGDEMNIRLFSYLFLHDSYQDLEWPFQTISIEYIKKQLKKETAENFLNMSSTNTRAIYFVYAIIHTRVLHEYYMFLPISDDMRAMFTIFSNNFDVTLIFQKDFLNDLSPKNKLNEMFYFNFLTHIFISNIIPREEKVNMGDVFLSENHPYCVLSRKILNNFTNSNNVILLAKDKASMMYFITLLNTFYFLVDDTFNDFINLLIPQPWFHLNLQNIRLENIKNKLDPLIYKHNHQELLSCLLYTLARSYVKPKITIYIQVSKDFTSNYMIETRLFNLYNPENVVVTKNYQMADIIITDTLEKAPANKKIFYIDSINNEKNWEELVTIIQKTYLEIEKGLLESL